MGTRRIHIVLFLCLSGIISLQFQCEKRFDCAQNVYGFVMGIKAYPDKDSIQVGDTIWFEINEPTTLKDGQTGNMIDYSGAANLSTVISFNQLAPDSSGWSIKAADKFKIMLLKGKRVESIDPTFERQYIFSEENQFYNLKLGIIPKELGIFTLLFSNAANVYRKKDECTKASFFLHFKNTDQHYHLSPFYNGDTTIVGGDYYFKVY